MPKPNLSPLFDRINARAYAILQQHGATLAQLQEYSLDELNAIKGIGDRWATDIRTALDSLQPVPAVAQPPDLETLADDHEDWILASDNVWVLAPDHADADAPTAIELANTPMDELSDQDAATLLKAVLTQEISDDEPAIDMALRYLLECGREADAMVLEGKVATEGEGKVLETAIAIIEGLPGGALPKNLAQDVRDRAGL